MLFARPRNAMSRAWTSLLALVDASIRTVEPLITRAGRRRRPRDPSWRGALAAGRRVSITADVLRKAGVKNRGVGAGMPARGRAAARPRRGRKSSTSSSTARTTRSLASPRIHVEAEVGRPRARPFCSSDGSEPGSPDSWRFLLASAISPPSSIAKLVSSRSHDRRSRLAMSFSSLKVQSRASLSHPPQRSRWAGPALSFPLCRISPILPILPICRFAALRELEGLTIFGAPRRPHGGGLLRVPGCETETGPATAFRRAELCYPDAMPQRLAAFCVAGVGARAVDEAVDEVLLQPWAAR